MAHVFKRKGSRFWYVRHVDRHGNEKVRSSKLTDKREALRWGNRVEEQEQRVKLGLISPAEVEAVAASSTPIATHLEDFIADDMRRGLAERRIQMKRSVLSRFFREEGIRTATEIDAEAIERHMHWMVETGVPSASDGRCTRGGRRRRIKLSPSTANEFRTTVIRFLNWLVEKQRLAYHPCPGKRVRRMRPGGDPRRSRRAMTPEEVERLFAYADEHGRGAVYRVALLTGLRRSELEQLQWRDVRLDETTPCLRLRAGTTKAKRADVIPLHRIAAETLARLPGRKTGSGGRVFEEVPSVHQLYRDLDGAGIQACDGRRAVPNAAGEVVDFHAFRMTLGTMLANAGMNVLHLKRIMRHASIATTDRHYAGMTLADLGEQFGVLGSVPGVYRILSCPQARGGANGCEPVPDPGP